MTGYSLQRAWVDGTVLDDVLVEVAGGRFTRVTPDVAAADVPRATRLDGLTLPGLANAHSHAFHRALRGRTQRQRGTFWTWREQMYDVAGRLTPDSYRELAAATFREMVVAGYTSVGEFHYLHHQPDGTLHEEPNAMRDALRDAAETASIRLVLLDTAYLSSGFGAPPEGVQVRYSDGSGAAWAARAGAGPAAIHSVRAVPRDELHHLRGRHPLHVHLSEQVAENDGCLAAYGLTPAGLLHAEGLLGPRTTVVHATHLTDDDIELLGSTRTSDSHAVVDPFEELRGLEMHERLATRARGHFTAAELLDVATAHDVLGLGDVGRIEVGARADLVTLDTTSPRTAGTGDDEHTAVFAATAADVTHVVVDGRVAHRRGDEPTVGGALTETIGRIWS